MKKEKSSFNGTGTPGAEKNSSFYWGFMLLTDTRREALTAVYGYCRLIDDIVDSGALTSAEAGEKLAFWRAEIDRLYTGSPTHPVALALRRPVSEFDLPKDAFLEVIRGCRMDLDKTRYMSFKNLESYLQGVACAVGTLSAEIFGHRYTSPSRLREFTRCFGYAFQLTNIIRDVGADLAIGRIYLPEDDIRQAGYSVDALKKKKRDPAFLRLMDLEYRRAKGFYSQGRAALDPRDRKAMLPAEIMAHIYEGLLDHLKARHFPVFGRPVKPPKWRKAFAAGKAFLYTRGITL